MANKHPTMVQQATPATAILFTTTSHCARVTTGLNTRVNGEAKAGTALNPLSWAGGRRDGERAFKNLEGGGSFSALVMVSCLLHLC